MTAISQRFLNASKDLKFFLIASFLMGIGYSIFDSIFNNFLHEEYAISGWQRSFLEFPREIPGFLVVFVSAGLWFMCTRRIGAFALALSFTGALLIGYAAPTYTIMVSFLFIYSMGQHLFMPSAAVIGMDLAREGQTGRRLGQLNSIRNLATILGSFLVFLTFKYFGFTYKHGFTMVAIALILAAIFIFMMEKEKDHKKKTFLTIKREYTLYYVLNILYGSRKQLFITFAPWVIVSIFNKPTQTLATLLTIGGIIGVFFQPILGKLIDKKGERFVLLTEALILALICIGYGFARDFLSEFHAFIAIAVFYLIDQILMSVNMARSMYIRKIALEPADVQPALAAGVTIDHIFSISVALLGGWIWNTFGYQYVFLLGSVIAVINYFAVLRMRVPEKAL